MMRGARLAVVWLVLGAVSSVAAAPYLVDGPQVTAGALRLTVLSPTLLRIEASQAGRFVDEPSVLVADRAWPTVPFTVARSGEWLVVRTAALELRCLPDQAPPTKQSLQVSWHTGDRQGSWAPGQADQGNLGGTRGALDGIKAGSLPPLDPGLLSREGWTLLDDSRRPLWLGEEKWLQPRPEGAGTDWYFFAYGDDYSHLLGEYVRLCGRIPMLPRYAWGTWFSRYWDYSAAELQDLVRTFDALDIPLDVLVIDVDWHKYGWEGYDWNEKQFPDPAGLLAWLHRRGLRVTLNNHPGSALPVEDTHHAAAATMAGLTAEEARKPLAWDLANQKHSRAFVEAVHWPLEKLGIDFWWIDGNPPAKLGGLDSAMWCAKTYYDGTARRSGERGLTFSRYGGLGQHRYPAGFSGDVYSQWEVLNYEVRYTSRAGNVAFPYWSHDIGGFMGDRLDPELYVRWCQFGALSPILRLHSNHGVREPWSYGPEAQRIVRDYFLLRRRLYPYLNTCQRETYQTGRPLCRALYMHWPKLPEAYRYDYEYLLGPDLLVVPVTQHTRPEGTVPTEVWLPPGLWWDYWTGAAYQGPRTLVYRAELARCPLFVRAGAIIPLQPETGRPGASAGPITLRVWAGAGTERQLYEDDGLSLGYTRGQYADTPLRLRCEGDRLALTIGPARGTYEGAPAQRTWLVEFNGLSAPAAVRVDGRPTDNWTYDAEGRRATVRVPRGPVARAHQIEVLAAASATAAAAQATAGAYRAGAAAALEALAAGASSPQPVTTPTHQALATLANAATAGAKPPELAALLRQAWQTVGSAANLSAVQRQAVLAALVGVETTCDLTPTQAAGERRLTARLAAAVPLPGATIEGQARLPEGWKATGEGGAASAGETAEVSATAQPPTALANPPLGLLAYGADFTLRWAGQELAVAARAGLDCSFVQQWHLLGPFPNKDSKGLDAVFAPEEKLDLTASYAGIEAEAKWQTVDWQLPAAGDPAVFINFEPRFKPAGSAVGYGVAKILSERETPALFSLGSDDSCKVWLNGKLVHEFREPRPPAPGVDKVPVTLRAGENTVLFKVVNYGGQWGLYLQVLGRDEKPLGGLRTGL